MHNRNSISFLEACYRADDKTLAAKVMASVKKDLQQQVKFYNTLSGNKADAMENDKKMAESYLQALSSMEQMFGNKPAPAETSGNIVTPTAPAQKDSPGKK